MNDSGKRAFGDGDASLEAIGGEAGIAKLVDTFYDLMESLPETKPIRDMHPPDLTVSREKLKVFLVGWLGGPRRYAEKWGPIRIPKAHAHLSIGPSEHDQWLLCMDRAIESLPISAEFAAYFKREIRVPAGRVMSASKFVPGP